MKLFPAGAEQSEIGKEMPQGIERRLVLRLLAHWRNLCGERKFPSFADLDPTEIPEMWLNSFVLEISEDQAEPVFRAMGDALVQYSGRSLVGQPAASAPVDKLPGIAIAYVNEVTNRAVPISRGGEFVKDDGTRVLYRSILLPMSDDGELISGILGAANCREIVNG